MKFYVHTNVLYFGHVFMNGVYFPINVRSCISTITKFMATLFNEMLVYFKYSNSFRV